MCCIGLSCILLCSGNQKSPTSTEDVQGDSKSLDADLQNEPEVELIYPLFIAKYDYTSKTGKEMSFKRGDQFFIINNNDDDWWVARTKYTGQEGCVPNNYISKSPLDAEE